MHVFTVEWRRKEKEEEEENRSSPLIFFPWNLTRGMNG
jgi:hypothetical protein